jgi:hypothetical protein
MPNIWQMAAGEGGRYYDDLFLAHDVMFLGPGRFGPFDREAYQQVVREGLTGNGQIRQIRHFVERMQPGDYVLLRKGTTVLTVGIVTEDPYAWDPAFNDVYGWDLEHTRRVCWQRQLTSAFTEHQREHGDIFKGLLPLPTFTAVKDLARITRIEAFCQQCKSSSLVPLPAVPEPLTLDALGQELFARGLPNEVVDRVLVAIQRQRRLSHWYREHGRQASRPAEHEVVAHMILPLLLALGWSEQLLAIEWHKVDLTAFWGTPTDEERCVLVCEAKGIGHGLQDVVEQAKRYVRSLKLVQCQKILVTDGTRLYLYQRDHQEEDGWSAAPVGYLNVNLIRTNHVAPAGTNAVDTIVALTPAGVTRPL